MAAQSPLRLIKRWKRYEPRPKWQVLPRDIRGVYVLYDHKGQEIYNTVYIGVAGLGPSGRGSVRQRLKRHNERIKGWTHFSCFEVHDNITADEIRELEALLLGIFRHDPRIDLTNKQKGSKKLNQLRRLTHRKER